MKEVQAGSHLLLYWQLYLFITFSITFCKQQKTRMLWEREHHPFVFSLLVNLWYLYFFAVYMKAQELPFSLLVPQDCLNSKWKTPFKNQQTPLFFSSPKLALFALSRAVGNFNLGQVVMWLLRCLGFFREILKKKGEGSPLSCWQMARSCSSAFHSQLLKNWEVEEWCPLWFLSVADLKGLAKERGCEYQISLPTCSELLWISVLIIEGA